MKRKSLGIKSLKHANNNLKANNRLTYTDVKWKTCNTAPKTQKPSKTDLEPLNLSTKRLTTKNWKLEIESLQSYNLRI